MLVNARLDNIFFLFAHRYLYADGFRPAQSRLWLPYTAVSSLWITFQVETDLQRGRRDLRIMAKTRDWPLRQDLSVQCDKSRWISERRAKQAAIPTSWTLRIQVKHNNFIKSCLHAQAYVNDCFVIRVKNRVKIMRQIIHPVHQPISLIAIITCDSVLYVHLFIEYLDLTTQWICFKNILVLFRYLNLIRI